MQIQVIEWENNKGRTIQNGHLIITLESMKLILNEIIIKPANIFLIKRHPFKTMMVFNSVDGQIEKKINFNSQFIEFHSDMSRRWKVF